MIVEFRKQALTKGDSLAICGPTSTEGSNRGLWRGISIHRIFYLSGPSQLPTDAYATWLGSAHRLGSARLIYSARLGSSTRFGSALPSLMKTGNLCSMA